eukprot:3367618-Rhodomonas_salina.1
MSHLKVCVTKRPAKEVAAEEQKLRKGELLCRFVYDVEGGAPHFSPPLLSALPQTLAGLPQTLASRQHVIGKSIKSGFGKRKIERNTTVSWSMSWS